MGDREHNEQQVQKKEVGNKSIMSVKADEVERNLKRQRQHIGRDLKRKNASSNVILGHEQS